MKFGESTRLQNFSSLLLLRGATATRHVLKKEKLHPFVEGCLINTWTKGGARNKWLICSHCRQDNGPICKAPTETKLMARACLYHLPEICYEFDMQKPRILL